MIELRGVSKTVPSGTGALTILHPIDLAIDAGRVVAIDTPAALAGRGGPFGQRIRFRTPEPVDPSRLMGLAHVTDVGVDGEEVVVSGDDGVLLSLATAFTRDGITATHLRMDVPTLDDAFLAMTGATIEEGAA